MTIIQVICIHCQSASSIVRNDKLKQAINAVAEETTK